MSEILSRPWVEAIAQRIIDHRRMLVAVFLLLTVVLAGTATMLRADAAFTKMIPLDHPFMKVFMKYQSVFGGANRVLVAVSPRQGDIYTPQTMDLLRQVTEEVFYIKGVERSSVTSLFTPNVRYMEVVEEGFRGGNIVSADFQGRPEQIEQVRVNVGKSDWLGRIVARDGSSAMVVATLQEMDSESGRRVDLRRVAHDLEEIRTRHESPIHSIEIIGFAKAVGDIADGAAGVLVFFAIAFGVTLLLLLLYSRSWMLTLYALGCALIPVVWLLGLMPLLGLGLDPMSILVPFLIFSIAVSHAVQMTNAWRLEILAGSTPEEASRRSCCKLFIPGAMALVANGLGFLVIAFVNIEIVQELALTATLGVTLMIVSNKLLLPALLSYRSGANLKPPSEKGMEGLWRLLSGLVRPVPAALCVALSAAVLAGGLWIAKDLQIGDLGKGVPELRPDARYNQDVAAITQKFAIGVDVMQVIIEADGKESPCVDSRVIDPIGEFELQMRQNPGVSAVSSLAGFSAAVSQAYAENNVKWRALPEDPVQLAQGTGAATRLGNVFMNPGCTAMPAYIYTRDHQAATIQSVVDDVHAFAREHGREDLRFQIGLGNLSVMAATNQVVAAADKWVNLALFASVSLLCLVAFRSVRITLCIIIPLAIVTVLCNAVMTMLGIGVKVNTLPVVALGVGVGVDYGIYLFERIRHGMVAGMTLQEALLDALRQRGTASLFTAVTMTLSVITWMGSELQFQSDMGILLGFMFLVNLFGAVLLLPALAAFLVGDGWRDARPHGVRPDKESTAI
jgi:predicted RND superfamily exporter protein